MLPQQSYSKNNLTQQSLMFPSQEREILYLAAPMTEIQVSVGNILNLSRVQLPSP